jgi:hypothetical protein
MDNLIYVWPCGTWCHREGLETQLKSKSNDYEALTWDEFNLVYPEEME